MAKLVRVLAVVTLIFAGSSLYLANELRVELRRAAASQTATAAPSVTEQGNGSDVQSIEPNDDTDPSQTSEDVQTFASTADAATTANSEPRGDTSRDPSLSAPDVPGSSRRDARSRRFAADLIAKYEDPIAREKLIASARIQAQRQLDRDGFSRIAGLTSDETNRLTALLAEQTVESNVLAARCTLDPDCMGPRQQVRSPEAEAARRQQLADALGPDMAERYETFQSSLQERRAVLDLRTRLPDDAMLAKDDAERLIDVLARERQKFVAEIEQGGGTVGSMSIAGGNIVFYRRAERGSRNAVPGFSADLASAEAFSERMKKSAAQVLTSDQMRVFAEMQDELVGTLRQRLRNAQMRPTPRPPPSERSRP